MGDHHRYQSDSSDDGRGGGHNYGGRIRVRKKLFLIFSVDFNHLENQEKVEEKQDRHRRKHEAMDEDWVYGTFDCFEDPKTCEC